MNETKIAVSFNNEVKNLDQVTKYERELQKVYGYVSALKNPKATQALKEMDKTAKVLSKEVKENQKETKKIGDILGTAFNIKVIEGFTKGITKLGKGMFSLAQKSSEYVENVNLLEVAYKNANETIEQSSKRIETYIDKMAEVYGLDESRLTRQFGIFKQLANAMQLPTETAENLSEIMVKMTNDIASLYNLDLNRASNALQSALAGQVRPIRSATGADITEKTLQTTVDALGLDRTINQLSYVEKRLVMVISLTNQLKASQGDYARTIESSANQIRVMHEQWDRLSRAVGNIFYPILQKVMPWINGILMALTEIFNLLASFLGFKMPEFDYSGLVGVSDLAQDIEDELGGAGEAVDNLANKLKGLRNFDKLNVINTPSASSAGGVAGGSIGGIGDIDPKIMDAFNKAFGEYDDMMGKVQMKAEKIRDNIMEWLGFTKEINPLTGEISWKFDHITSGTVLGGLAVGGFIYTGVKKIFQMISSLTGLKFTGLQNILSALASPVIALAGGITLGELLSLLMQKGGNWAEKNLGTFGAGLNSLNPYKDNDMWGMWGDIKNMATGRSSYFNKKIDTKTKELLELAQANPEIADYILNGPISYENGKLNIKNQPDALKNLQNTLKAKYSTTELPTGVADYYSNRQSYNILDFMTPGVGWLNLGRKAMHNAISDVYTSLSDYEGEDAYLEHYEEIIKDVQKYLQSENTLFGPITDDSVVLMNNYTDAVTRYFDTINGKYSQTQGFIDAISQSNDAFASASEGLDILLTQMSAEQYEITAEDINKINQYLYEMQTASNQASQAFFDAVTGMTIRLQEQGYVSDEVAKKVIDNAYRKKLAEEGATQDYIDKALALQKQLQNNEITTDEYYKAMVQLNNEYRKAPSSLQRLKSHIDVMNSSIKISAENWDEVSLNLQTTKGYFDETMTSMNEDYQNQIALIDEWLAVTEKDSDEYNQLLKLRESLNREFTNNMKDAQDGYVNYLLTTLQAINESYEEGDQQAEQFMQHINEELSKYGVEVDLSAGKENVNKQVDELQKGIEGRHPKIIVDAELNKEAFQNLFRNVGHAFANMPSIGGISFSGMAPAFYNMANAFYAQGGLPPVGQLFVANEKGPELVGHIGGQSFVANQNQMMDLLDKKIGNAQSNKPQVFNIYLDADHKIGTYTLDQLEDMAKTNGQPITIGG